MARKIDITEKLAFDENPSITIKGKDYEIKADAKTVLQIMGILGESGSTPKAIVEMYELIFPKKTRDAIDKLNLQFKDFSLVVEAAIELITGEADDDEEGEGETHATT